MTENNKNEKTGICCSNCNNTNFNVEKLQVNSSSKEIVIIERCTNCMNVLNTQIQRPFGMVLRKTRGAREIRYSESEKRNFSSTILSMMEIQINLLAKIAIINGVDRNEVKEIVENEKITEYKYLLGEDDLGYPVGSDD